MLRLALGSCPFKILTPRIGASTQVVNSEIGEVDQQLVFKRWKKDEKLTPEKWEAYKNRNVNVADMKIPKSISSDWRAENQAGGDKIYGFATKKKGVADTVSPMPTSKRYARTREMQRICLESDGKVPIHMVLPRDRAAFYSTMALTVFCLVYLVTIAFRMMFDMK